MRHASAAVLLACLLSLATPVSADEQTVTAKVLDMARGWPMCGVVHVLAEIELIVIHDTTSAIAPGTHIVGVFSCPADLVHLGTLRAGALIELDVRDRRPWSTGALWHPRAPPLAGRRYFVFRARAVLVRPGVLPIR